MLRNRKGFTLIELLIVVVIIGILAAIALPKFGQTRERAYISAMQSDLRNLQTAQEMLYNTGSPANCQVGVDCVIDPYNYKQTDAITDAAPDTDLNFQASSGVTITLAAGGMAPGTGYEATAEHAAFAGDPDGITCVVTVGDPTASQAIICN
jgi:prepilin-type N-terminal cleavage/methylation domain-containing protein